MLLISCDSKNNDTKVSDIIKVEDITSVEEKIDIDENWQEFKFKNNNILYCPKNWIFVDNDYSAYYRIDKNIIFYLDIMKPSNLSEKTVENEIISSLKKFSIKENKIMKIQYNNSSSVLYHFEIVDKKENNLQEISNLFMDRGYLYRFTLGSAEDLDRAYLDTLDIITNTYMLKPDIRLIPFKNGHKSIDFIEKK